MFSAVESITSKHNSNLPYITYQVRAIDKKIVSLLCETMSSRRETPEDDGEEESKEEEQVESRANPIVAADSVILEEDLDPNYIPQSTEGK